MVGTASDFTSSGYHVVAAKEKGTRPRVLNQVDLRTRAGADGNLRMLAGGIGQGNDVGEHVVVHGHLLHRFPHRDQIMGVHNLIHGRLGRSPLQAAAQHRRLLLFGQIAQFEPDREAVQLRLGQRIGALVFDRVVGGQHDERVG